MKRFKLFLKRLLAYIPTPLPRGMTEYKVWEASIVELCGNISTPADLSWVIAAETMRLTPTRALVPKAFFLRVIRVAAAKQLAGAVFSDLKAQQQAGLPPPQPTKPVEATTPTPTATSEQKN